MDKNERNRIYAKETQHWYHDRGLCVKCHARDAYTMNGRYLCFDCSEKEKEYAKDYRARNKDKIAKKAKKRREELKKNGLCTKCGKPNDTNTTRCSVCKAKQSKYDVELKQRKTGYNPNRGNNGFCYQCNKKIPVDGYKLCSECLERARALMLQNRRKPSEEHKWRKLNQRDVYNNMARSSRMTGK